MIAKKNYELIKTINKDINDIIMNIFNAKNDKELFDRLLATGCILMITIITARIGIFDISSKNND